MPGWVFSEARTGLLDGGSGGGKVNRNTAAGRKTVWELWKGGPGWVVSAPVPSWEGAMDCPAMVTRGALGGPGLVLELDTDLRALEGNTVLCLGRSLGSNRGPGVAPVVPGTSLRMVSPGRSEVRGRR